MTNIDHNTVASFGDEWSRFDQNRLSSQESKKTFEEYFSVFPWGDLPENAVGFDMGCGSGRWAKWVALKVGHLHCIDPSDAIEIAKINLLEYKNLSFHKLSVSDMFAPNESQDFGYSLGVLHHVPDTELAIKSCVNFLKPGAPFLLYLYYAFDNRSKFFKVIWMLSDLGRKVVSKLSPQLKHTVTDVIAVLVYWPLSRLCLVLVRFGFSVNEIPLSYYRKHSFYTMRTDSRDRFGTPLEKRFTKLQITEMLKSAGLVDILFSDKQPFWCVVGRKPLKSSVLVKSAP